MIVVFNFGTYSTVRLTESNSCSINLVISGIKGHKTETNLKTPVIATKVKLM